MEGHTGGDIDDRQHRDHHKEGNIGLADKCGQKGRELIPVYDPENGRDIQDQADQSGITTDLKDPADDQGQASPAIVYDDK